jgi:hypothetical protein
MDYFNVCIAVFMLFLTMQITQAEDKKANIIEFAGYQNCILLENEHTRLILEPDCGGRVMEYSYKGVNAIWLNTKQDGWIYEPGKRHIDPCGGRLDIGPEMVIPKHPVLWLSRWKGEITGPLSARLISQKDPATGVQLIREFTLAEDSSRVQCTQIIKNVSEKTKYYFHWGRTLVRSGGIAIVPLNPHSRYPAGYLTYGPGSIINYLPEDQPNVSVRDGYVEIAGVPAVPKFAIDSYAGWLAYLMREGLLFVKKFPVYPKRMYGEIAANSVCIYYAKAFCELEPIGPQEKILPGKSVSYTEEWWLLPHTFPAEGEKADLKAIEKSVNSIFKK